MQCGDKKIIRMNKKFFPNANYQDFVTLLGNGTVCDDLDECSELEPCSMLTSCVNMAGGYYCSPCPKGYTETNTTLNDYLKQVNLMIANEDSLQ